MNLLPLNIVNGVLILHGRHDTDEQLKVYFTQVAARVAPGIPVVLSRDDYHARAAQLGGWNPWISDVVGGYDSVKRLPRYYLYVVPGDGDVGRATMEIVKGALRLHKQVYYLTPEGGLIPVLDVQHNGKGHKDGWSLVVQ